MPAKIEITYDPSHKDIITVTVSNKDSPMWDGSGPTVESALFAALQETANAALSKMGLDEVIRPKYISIDTPCDTCGHRFGQHSVPKETTGDTPCTFGELGLDPCWCKTFKLKED